MSPTSGLGEILIRGLAVRLVRDELLVELVLLRDGGLELGLKKTSVFSLFGGVDWVTS